MQNRLTILLALLLSVVVGGYAYGLVSDVSTPTVNAAAVDYFLKIDGIDGESTDSGHRNSIEVDSFSWGVSNMGSHGAGGGGGAGKASFQDIHFTSMVSKASPKLMMAVATGQHIKEAKLFVRKAGGTQQDYYVITLQDILVTSYQSTGGGSGGDVPVDSFSLNYSKIEFDYRPQNSDGSLGSPVHGGWDLGKNKGI